jgi:hypothetical protein
MLIAGAVVGRSGARILSPGRTGFSRVETTWQCRRQTVDWRLGPTRHCQFLNLQPGAVINQNLQL